MSDRTQRSSGVETGTIFDVIEYLNMNVEMPEIVLRLNGTHCTKNKFYI